MKRLAQPNLEEVVGFSPQVAVVAHAAGQEWPQSSQHDAGTKQAGMVQEPTAR